MPSDEDGACEPMLRDFRRAGARAAPPARGTRPTQRRSWRRRSRRAQVSAVATILGLLLVVTFLANYIATTLPNTMGQNDLQHETIVENQVGELSAVLQRFAASGSPGAQLSQPISLGTDSAPPFAAPDGSSLLPLGAIANTSGNYPATMINFTLSGPGAAQLPVLSAGTAGFVVQLHNTYVTSAEVAFDQGAVVFAQPGGIPLFVAPPQVSYSNNVLSLFVPRFTNTVPGEAGSSTAVMSIRLLASSSVTLPSAGFTFLSKSSITVKWVTPYAATWYAYFEGVSSLASHVTCSGGNSVCTSLYQPGRSLGTVAITLPTSGLTLHVLSGSYAVSVT